VQQGGAQLELPQSHPVLPISTTHRSLKDGGAAHLPQLLHIVVRCPESQYLKHLLIAKYYAAQPVFGPDPSIPKGKRAIDESDSDSLTYPSPRTRRNKRRIVIDSSDYEPEDDQEEEVYEDCSSLEELDEYDIDLGESEFEADETGELNEPGLLVESPPSSAETRNTEQAVWNERKRSEVRDWKPMPSFLVTRVELDTVVTDLRLDSRLKGDLQQMGLKGDEGKSMKQILTAELKRRILGKDPDQVHKRKGNSQQIESRTYHCGYSGMLLGWGHGSVLRASVEAVLPISVIEAAPLGAGYHFGNTILTFMGLNLAKFIDPPTFLAIVGIWLRANSLPPQDGSLYINGVLMPGSISLGCMSFTPEAQPTSAVGSSAGWIYFPGGIRKTKKM
jgi:hypothetical protein